MSLESKQREESARDESARELVEGLKEALNQAAEGEGEKDSSVIREKIRQMREDL